MQILLAASQLHGLSVTQSVSVPLCKGRVTTQGHMKVRCRKPEGAGTGPAHKLSGQVSLLLQQPQLICLFLPQLKGQGTGWKPRPRPPVSVGS